MSHYVHRQLGGREGWIGPIRSEVQAGKEKAAWESCGWAATVHPSTPEIRAAVRSLAEIPQGGLTWLRRPAKMYP